MRVLALCAFLALTACGAPQPPLVVSELEVSRPMPGRHMSAGYLVLTNNTDKPLHISEVRSPQFGSVEIHQTTVTDGVSRMRELDGLDVPPQSSVTLERGGKHLMLMRPSDLEDAVTLEFFSAGAPVLSVTYVFPEHDNS